MNRRDFIILGLAGVMAAPALAQRPALFQPTRFTAEVRGRGPDVLLIPGLTAGPEVWRSTVASIPGHRYHLIHVAGFAGAPARGNARGPMIGALADELIRYIESRGLARPVIVGHSMGGTLAMLIAARRPNLLGKIMVVDMLPEPAGLFGGNAAEWGPLARSLGTMMNSPGGQQLFANLMGAFSPPNAGNRRSDSNVVGRAMSELTAMDLTPQLPRIRVPLTVVYASPDPRARTAVDRSFRSAYASARGARFQRIDNSGHMVMLDQPAQFHAAIRTFLSR